MTIFIVTKMNTIVGICKNGASAVIMYNIYNKFIKRYMYNTEHYFKSDHIVIMLIEKYIM